MQVFTSLSMGRFDRVVGQVAARGGGPGGLGRPWTLPLAERVLMVAVYYRTNLTMRQLGPLFAVSAATVHRVVAEIGPYLALEPVAGRDREPSRFTNGRGRALWELWMIVGAYWDAPS